MGKKWIYKMKLQLQQTYICKVAKETEIPIKNLIDKHERP